MVSLKVHEIDVFYENIQALRGVSLTIQKGKIVALIGANGAGKTTLLKTISGILKPTSGTIEYMGKMISNTKPAQIGKMGIAHAPEGRKVFPQMTVLENLELGAYLRTDGKSEQQKDLQWIFDIFPILKERKNQISATLSGGEQQMLTIGRALMAHPTLLLLDEPSMGLAPILVKTIFQVIKQINNEGLTILLVEQNSFMALSIAEKGYVLENGRIAMEDKGIALLDTPEIKNSYLGKARSPRRKQRKESQKRLQTGL